jgi:hypothetical protein
VVAPSAHAVRGYDTFNTTPMSKFSKEDAALMMENVNRALKAEKDGDKLDWKSATTPASGSVTPLARFTADGLACRRLRVLNAYGELKNEGVYRFCEKPAGKWKLIGRIRPTEALRRARPAGRPGRRRTVRSPPSSPPPGAPPPRAS